MVAVASGTRDSSYYPRPKKLLVKWVWPPVSSSLQSQNSTGWQVPDQTGNRKQNKKLLALKWVQHSGAGGGRSTCLAYMKSWVTSPEPHKSGVIVTTCLSTAALEVRKDELELKVIFLTWGL